MREEMPTARQVRELRIMEQVLRPFMKAQKALEGQKYVTNSLMVYIVGIIRTLLEEAREESDESAVKDMINGLLSDEVNGLNAYFGSGEPGTIFTENDTRSVNQSRQKGFNKKTLLAYYLDPRTKVR